jgi:hypothetical protein
MSMSSSSSSSSPSSTLCLRVSCSDNPLLNGVENDDACENPSVEDLGDDSAEDCGGGVGIRSRCCAEVRIGCDFGLEDKGGEPARKSEDEERCEGRSPDVANIGASACCAGNIWVVAIAVVRGVWNSIRVESLVTWASYLCVCHLSHMPSQLPLPDFPAFRWCALQIHRHSRYAAGQESNNGSATPLGSWRGSRNRACVCCVMLRLGSSSKSPQAEGGASLVMLLEFPEWSDSTLDRTLEGSANGSSSHSACRA